MTAVPRPFGLRAFFYLALFSRLLAFVIGADDCTAGAVVEDSCVKANEDEADEFFYCTDRYSWEWSQEVSQLPSQASDSMCITIDSDVVEGVDETEVMVVGGCNADFQEIGGSCSSLSSTTHSFNPLTDTYTERDDMPTPRFRSAAVNVSEHIYLFGGRDINNTLVCTVERYDVIENVWESLTGSIQDVNCFSDHSGVASDDGTIYLFGGYNAEYEPQSTVVKVEISGDDLTFSTSEPLGTKRGDHVCAKVPASSEVYCIGGFTFEDEDYVILESVERFDMSTETWEYKAPMVYPRADFAVGHLNNRITVVGGEDDSGPMDGVEWYDIEADCWIDSGDLFDLPYKRLRYCGATHQSDQRIYIFGGQSLPGPTDGTYTISETVNWYQEILLDQLSPSSASRTLKSATLLSFAAVIGGSVAQLLF